MNYYYRLTKTNDNKLSKRKVKGKRNYEGFYNAEHSRDEDLV